MSPLRISTGLVIALLLGRAWARRRSGSRVGWLR